MPRRPHKVDAATQTTSETSLEARISRPMSFDSRYNIPYDKALDNISFQEWHKRMQRDHVISHGKKIPNYSIWKWCNLICTPCALFDSIDYNTKLCLICCKVKTCKTWTTSIFILIFFYFILYMILGDDALPGGTYFLLNVMFLSSFVLGNVFNFGIPPAVVQIAVGVFFGNLPLKTDDDKVYSVTEHSEKLILIIILIRAALQLEFSEIYKQCTIILQYAFLPYICEFSVIIVLTHYLLGLPWEWSALQGVLFAPVCLSSVLSNMERRKIRFLFIERNEMIGVLVAASTTEVVTTIYAYSILLAAIFSKGVPWAFSWWALVIAIILQILGGFFIGLILGCVAGMFPDRRSAYAPHSRILFVACATIGLVLGFHKLGMVGVGVLSSMTMVFIASNIWTELGWHENSNPVIYFYSTVYFFMQPICVSLVGFQLKFSNMGWQNFGITLTVIVVGLIARELCVFCLTLEKAIPTNWSEKVFIMVSWLPKGAVEALLGATLRGITCENINILTNPDQTEEELIEYTVQILHTLTIGILITVPLVSVLTTVLIPFLYKRQGIDILYHIFKYNVTDLMGHECH